MTIFDGRDYKRKACLKFYFHCGPLKISKCKVQNVGNTKAKTDTKCYQKKITQRWRRWGTPQNFLLTFIDELCKTRKIWILKKMKKKKNCWRYHFTHVYQKPQSYEVRLLRYGGRNNLLSSWTIFCPFTYNNPENQNFKKRKKHLEMSSFHACAPKRWSYDVCLLRYGVQQTWLSVIVGHFLLFYPTIESKN